MKHTDSHDGHLWTDFSDPKPSRSRLNNHLNTPLYKNAYFLIANNATNALLGLIFWLLVARLFSDNTAEVGIGTTLTATVTFLAGLSTLGAGFGLIRFLSGTGEKAPKMINSCFTLSALTSLIVSLIFLGIVGIWFKDLVFVRDDPIYAIIFILLTMVWTLFILCDYVFIAERTAKFTFAKNIIMNCFRFPFVILFAVVLGIGAFGILSSAGLATAIGLGIALLWFLPRVAKGYRPIPTLQRDMLGRIIRYSLSNYLAEMFWGAPILLFPLMVLSMLGKEMSAYFYMTWQLSTVLLMVPGALAASLFAEGSFEEDKLRSNTLKAMGLSIAILIPSIAGVFLLGNKLLSLFGPEYSENATTLLWILAVSAIPMGINSFYISVIRVKKDITRIIVVSAVTACFTLGLSYIFMTEFGLWGMGLGWLIGQTMVAIAVIVPLLRQSASSETNSVLTEEKQ